MKIVLLELEMIDDGPFAFFPSHPEPAAVVG
jgi:hypothetical protein